MRDPARPAPGSATLGLIRSRARARPDAPAILDGDRSLSYRGLLEQARVRARELAAAAVGPGDRVAVETGPGTGFAVALLASWLLGAVPVPVDPASPAQRRAYQLRQAGCVACLAAPGADGLAAQVTAEIRADGAAGSSPGPTAAGLAYILFTSGSTGQPKGVEVGHAGLVNVLIHCGQMFRLRPGRGMLAHCSPAFDMALVETLAPLVMGGTVVVAPAHAARNPERFAAWLRGAPVHAAAATPTMFRMLLPYLSDALAEAVVGSGGEVLPAALAEQLHSVTKELWNGYGPTEATIAALLGLVGPAQAGPLQGPLQGPLPDPVPIGRPIAGMAAEILDGRLRPVEPGERGELCLSGTGLAAGYVNDPELTREAFVTGPAGNRIYRTGDICSQREDGQYEFHGRRDDQVKIRGHRIELGEIEMVAERSPSVACAVAVTCGPEPARAGVYLALLPAAGSRPDPVAVTADLRRQLPPYMVPARVIMLAELPRNQAGKVDRAAVRRHVDAVLRTGGDGRGPSPR
ncbi:MAG: amino acid adenylation domain-containing protein [Streptosporangiaceae bacterium]|nr:amino acid adenylation domain-containing protein [Streptosporangiaceae bacterium]